MTSSSSCVFCEIVQGKREARRVYEDERVTAFWDAKPVRPIHILIVPKEHIPTLNDVAADDDILAHLGRAARSIAESFGVAESGYRVFINVNAGGGQVIFHLHVHLIAKTAGESV